MLEPREQAPGARLKQSQSPEHYLGVVVAGARERERGALRCANPPTALYAHTNSPVTSQCGGIDFMI